MPDQTRVAPHTSDPVDAVVADVRAELWAAADPDRAPAMQAYMKSALPYYGVSMPQCRRLWRRCFDVALTNEQWLAAQNLLWDEADYREERYAAIGLARHRRFAGLQDAALLPHYARFIVDGAWWDLVDEIATHLVRDLLDADPDTVAPQLRAWSTAPDMWLRRTAIICQVGRGEDLDQRLLTDSIEANLDGSSGRGPAMSAYGKEFFIRKAIGWALRDHARSDPAFVAEYVDQHRAHLSGLSIREATKHL